MPYNNKVINETPPMATRSRIGIELSDGSILSVYCHWDGYPEFNGVKLVEHFNSRDAVTELIDGGDISALWTNAGWNNETLPETGPLYFSSRGENCPPRLDADLCEYLLAVNAEEYHYLFRNGKWVCYEMNPLGNELPKLIEIPSAALAV
jgi:hypothetical protein